MFDRSADLYDLIYDQIKDYGRENELLTQIILDRAPGARSVLDVACGTGRHLELMSDRFEVAGLDLDEALLAIAARRNPGARFVQGDMTSFDLGARFDVVMCLFSSIGYVVSRERLEQAVSCMAAHLEDDGVLLVEPWFFPETFSPGHVGAVLVDQPELKVARINSTQRVGDTSVLELHYLVGRPQGVTHLQERHELGLFSDEEYRAAFEMAGMDATFDPAGLMGRGLYVATRR